MLESTHNSITDNEHFLSVKIQPEKTTIPIKKATRDRLRKYGSKGETWDDIVNIICDNIDNVNKNNDKYENKYEDININVTPPVGDQ